MHHYVSASSTIGAVVARLDRVTRLAEDLTSARAESRIGELIEVLVESLEPTDHSAPATPAVSSSATHARATGTHGAPAASEDGNGTDTADVAALGAHDPANANAYAGLTAEGRAAHQGPEVDGTTTVTGLPEGIRVGDLVSAKVVASDGVDLIAEFAALVNTPDARPAVNLTA